MKKERGKTAIVEAAPSIGAEAVSTEEVKSVKALSTYGRQILKFFYDGNKYNNNGFNTIDDFYSHLAEIGFKDNLEAYLIDTEKGLTPGNIGIRLPINHLRKAQLRYDSDKLSHGDAVNLVKEVSAITHDLEMNYQAALKALNALDKDTQSYVTPEDMDALLKLKIYLSNAEANLEEIRSLLLNL